MARKEVSRKTRFETEPPTPPLRRDALIFAAVLAALTALSLVPLWSSRLLPMQDYPQHLLLSQIAATIDNPGLDWGEWYRVDLGFAPYMLWYLATTLLIPAVGVEAAGKLVLSLYILLVSLLAWKARRLCPDGRLPWGALLLFPFAFNQLFFLGFANYLISVPIIFLALLDLERRNDSWSAATLGRHALYLALLFLSHPYSVLAYLVLASVSVVAGEKRGAEALRSLAPAALLATLLFVWHLTTGHGTLTPAGGGAKMIWLPINASFIFYLLPFTGMRWTNGVNFPVLLFWVVAALTLVVPWLGRKRDDGWQTMWTISLISFAGCLALPLWLGEYAFFNLRLAPLSYFALALLLSRLAVSVRRGLLLSVAAAALVTGSLVIHQQTAAEAETVLPIASKVTANSLVLPLIFDARPQAVDPELFPLLHAHEANYCNILAGGGGNPTLFPNPMMPVQYRPGVRLPSPRLPRDFSWSGHGAYYDYIVTRGALEDILPRLAPHCRLLATSGPWSIFRNLSARKPLPAAPHHLL